MNPSACLLQIGIYHGCFQIVSGPIAAAPEALVNTLFKNQFAEVCVIVDGEVVARFKKYDTRLCIGCYAAFLHSNSNRKGEKRICI